MDGNSQPEFFNGNAAPAPNGSHVGFIQQSRAAKVDELMRHNPAFMLATQVARRARRSHAGLNPYNLGIGEAIVGDYRAIGLTEQQYRTAKTQLAKWEIATFRATNKGTVARLTDSSIYNINAEPANDLDNRQATNDQRAANGQPTTKKNVRSEEAKDDNTASLLRPAGEELKFPSCLDVEVFRTSFAEWTEFRQGMGKKVKSWPALFNKQLEWLAAFGPADAREILAQSIRNGWQGLFPLKSQTTYTRKHHAPAHPAPSADSEW